MMREIVNWAEGGFVVINRVVLEMFCWELKAKILASCLFVLVKWRSLLKESDSSV